MNLKLKNKKIVITGASKGIGFEIAKSFSNHNTSLFINSRNLRNLHKAKKKINDKNLSIFPGDLTNILETKNTLLEKDLNQAVKMLETDLEKNTEFRIKWPRGEMGSLPADSEQYMLIEDLYGSVEKVEKQLEDMMHNKVNINFITKQLEKALEDIEELKDKVRINYMNGNGHSKKE